MRGIEGLKWEGRVRVRASNIWYKIYQWKIRGSFKWHGLK